MIQAPGTAPLRCRAVMLLANVLLGLSIGSQKPKAAPTGALEFGRA